MKPHRGWTIASSSWIFLRKRWLDWEQEQITVIQKETKRTEEKEEAGYQLLRMFGPELIRINYLIN